MLSFTDTIAQSVLLFDMFVYDYLLWNNIQLFAYFFTDTGPVFATTGTLLFFFVEITILYKSSFCDITEAAFYDTIFHPYLIKHRKFYSHPTSKGKYSLQTIHILFAA